MTTFRLSRVARIAALLAAVTILIAADGALARGNGGHNQSSDNNQMKSRDRSAKQPALREVRKDMNKGDMRSKNHQDRDARRAERKAEREAKRAQRKAERDARRAAKTTDKDRMNAGAGTTTTTATGNVHTIPEKTKDKVTGATTTTGATPASGGLLFDKGIVGRPITDIKQVPGSPAPGTVTGPGAGNTVRPIIVRSPGSPAPATSAPGRTEILQVGKVGTAPTGTKAAPAPGSVPGAANTVPSIPGSAAASGTRAIGTVTGPGKGIVTVTDAKGNSFIIPDHGGGVAVTSSRPGALTINNGVETRTVTGVKLTISGARTVSVQKGIQVGPAQADGSTVVLPTNGTVTGGPDGGFVHALGKGLADGVKDIAGHLDPKQRFQAHGPEGPPPPSGLPTTSTIQQE
jgi:hypothetical protein